ncbi:MAG: TlyA family RNA methyltransferase [Pseudomonadota bacterium]
MPSERVRLDQVLVDRGLARSRSQARDMILRGHVRLDGRNVARPAQPVSPDAVIEIDDPARHYVARSALKLMSALDAFDMSPAGRVALDVGASTGGFTQVLLERGATRVHAMDVGHDQLADEVANDPRVIRHDGLNARYLTEDQIGEQVRAITIDVSFISLGLVLGPVLTLAAQDAWLVALIKPQFEVGPDRIGKGGVVSDAEAQHVAIETVRNIVLQDGWVILDVIPSPILGGDGNREWLIGARFST